VKGQRCMLLQPGKVCRLSQYRITDDLNLPVGYISLPDFLKALRSLNVRSLMVEGGARVIQCFLTETQLDSEGRNVPIVDSIIITVAPTIVGTCGVGYDCDLTMQVSTFHFVAPYPFSDSFTTGKT
jgi:2,5-diamino-6-(ribosylamino)-4(3H)-pyrimidinone 5'-phosphate reductase